MGLNTKCPIHGNLHPDYLCPDKNDKNTTKNGRIKLKGGETMSEKDQFKRGMIVKNTETDKLGVVADDLWGCCSSKEIPVVYDGTNYSWGTDYRQLEIIGQENALADPKKCGAGRGEECCIFLVVNFGGFECQRFGDLRSSLIFTVMKAKRHPNRPYPDCQLIAG